MSERETVNARITSTAFGPVSHDMMTFFVTLEWPGSGQSVGGFALDQWNKATRKRDIGCGAAIVAIRRLLEVVGVEKWEDLPGKLVRAQVGRLGSSDPPIIGNIIEDKWFDIGKFMESAAAIAAAEGE